jgi:assimilatory nitrate reductase catalytic subunit
VGANTIRAAITAGCTSVDAVGQKLKAGTNCGSCRPEIVKLIAAGRS